MTIAVKFKGKTIQAIEFTIGSLVPKDRFIRGDQILEMRETDYTGRGNYARIEDTGEHIELKDMNETVQLISTKKLPNGFE